jgi:hypothetical protein
MNTSFTRALSRAARRLGARGAIAGTAGLVAVTLLISAPFVAHNAAEAKAASDISIAATTARHETEAAQRRAQTDWHIADAAARANAAADATYALAQEVIAATAHKVDVAPLVDAAAALSGTRLASTSKVQALTVTAQLKIDTVVAGAAEVDRIAAEQAAAAAAAAADALRNANTPDGAKATARDLASSSYGWGAGEFTCLSQLWQKESGWSYTAHNDNGGAHGIPQSLPASKMATAGADYMESAATQIAWGLGYIKRAYGSPCAAWAHSVSVNWY